jgi:hypothetical protein
MWIVGVVVFVLVSLVTLFLLWLDGTVERELNTLGDTPCPCCGDAYGVETARQARQDYLTRSAETRTQHPELRINFARFWQVRCPRCQASAKFEFETLRLAGPPLPEAGE